MEINNRSKMAGALLEKNVQTYVKALDENIKTHLQLTELYLEEYAVRMEKVFAAHVEGIQTAMDQQRALIRTQQEFLNQSTNKEITNG